MQRRGLAMVRRVSRPLVPFEEIWRRMRYLTRRLSKANNIVKARAIRVRRQGLTEGARRAATLPVPMIVHWNFNHFVVLKGFRTDGVSRRSGSRSTTVPDAEFNQAYTGIVMSFRRPRSSRAAASRQHVGGVRRRCRDALGLPYAVPPDSPSSFLVSRLKRSNVFVDDVLVKGMAIGSSPALRDGAARPSTRLVWLQQRHLLRFETKLAIDTSRRFFWHVIRLPVDSSTNAMRGDRQPRRHQR